MNTLGTAAAFAQVEQMCDAAQVPGTNQVMRVIDGNRIVVRADSSPDGRRCVSMWCNGTPLTPEALAMRMRAVLAKSWRVKLDGSDEEDEDETA